MYNTSNGKAMLLSCIALAVLGGTVGYIGKPEAVATTPDVIYLQKADLPLDLQLDQGNRHVVNEAPATFDINVTAKRSEPHVRYITKIRKVGVPKESVDSLVRIRADSLATLLVREEKTKDSVDGPKSSITLIENGQVIYKR